LFFGIQESQAIALLTSQAVGNDLAKNVAAKIIRLKLAVIA
jgi:hypothetical protein